jgi:hypothetical protein
MSRLQILLTIDRAKTLKYMYDSNFERRLVCAMHGCTSV